ncbi:MAG: hypothetical protein K0B14_18010 [Anaerolineaceae bacterium]|nr:hypothetical protein [Anaerolineaceae bacterium]
MSEGTVENKLADQCDVIDITFKGPFYWVCEQGKTSILESPSCRQSGVYFCSVSYQEKDLVYYIGQTGRWFSSRLAEHFLQHASGGYHLYEPNAFLRGEKIQVWPGRYDATQRTTISDFLDHFDELAPVIKKLASIYRFWVAPIDGDKRLRERLEAAMSIHLHNQPGIVGAFQDKGIHYNPHCKNEAPLIAKFNNYDQIHGLPSVLSF